MFLCCFFFFIDTATTEIYTLSLHDALPICEGRARDPRVHRVEPHVGGDVRDVGAHVDERHPARVLADAAEIDRKSTRLNSSHSSISYAVFCLKKKTIKVTQYLSISLLYQER